MVWILKGLLNSVQVNKNLCLYSLYLDENEIIMIIVNSVTIRTLIYCPLAICEILRVGTKSDVTVPCRACYRNNRHLGTLDACNFRKTFKQSLTVTVTAVLCDSMPRYRVYTTRRPSCFWSSYDVTSYFEVRRRSNITVTYLNTCGMQFISGSYRWWVCSRIYSLHNS